MVADRVRLTVDGVSVEVPRGTSVAAAILSSGRVRFHDAVTGGPRGPLCAMGICFDCVVSVNDRSRVRSCLLDCVEGMEVRTHE